MKKSWILICATALISVGLSKPVFAGGGTQISVTFESIKALTAKNGDTLDGSVQFCFADKCPGTHGEMLSSHAGGSGLGRDKEGKCRWALLGAFLKFQARAKAAGKTRIIGITTASSADTDADNTSGSAGNCLCNANAFKVSSLVKGYIAN
jgi:hypothetical protein